MVTDGSSLICGTGLGDSGTRRRDCEQCGGPINTFGDGYFRNTEDGTVRHLICHQSGEAPSHWVWSLSGGDAAQLEAQYNCGHKVKAPRTEIPPVCPECKDAAYVDGEWLETTGPSQNE